jgi:osmotically-inducible protein OsmY
LIRQNLSIGAFLGAMLLSGLGLAAFATDNSQPVAGVSVPGYAPDSVLADKAETLLRTDVGLAGSRFRVQGKSDVLTIAGTVPDEYAQRRALDQVSEMRGVREVRNALEIDAPK